ncbi:MAG: hypothetical protein K5839_06735, partial [Treponemataceae bacterium]|nr:hypothetical protein [Treponemataceae bacterium]
ENIPYTECNMADDFLIFFFLSINAGIYFPLQKKVYNYILNQGISSQRKIDSINKIEKIASSASVFSIISVWLDEFKKKNGDYPFSDEIINSIRKSTSFFLCNNIIQLRQNLVPELKDEAHKILCDYWGESFVIKMQKLLNE